MTRQFVLAALLMAMLLLSGCTLLGSETAPEPTPVGVPIPAPVPLKTPNLSSNNSSQSLGAVSSDDVKADLLNLLSRSNSTGLKIRYQTAYRTDPAIPSSIWVVYRQENLSRTDMTSDGLATRIYVSGPDTALCSPGVLGWTCANSSQEAANARTVDLNLPYRLSSLAGNFTMSKDQTFFGIRSTCYKIYGGEDFQFHELTITPNVTDMCLSPQGVVLYSRLQAQADGGSFEYTLSALNLSLTSKDSDFALPASLAAPVKPHMEMLFYDLGMGDATLIKADNVTLLIDTGSESTAESLAKDLLQQDISKIDVLLISSWDIDKLGGLESIFKRFTVSEIWVTGDPPAGRVFTYPWSVMHQVAVPIRNVSAGDSFTFGPVSLEVFNPPKIQFSKSPEANSAVLRIRYRGFCAFMPGDIEDSQHASLVGKVGSLSCNIYKWPYHGRGRPEASLLFDRLRPSDVVISVGENDQGLPSQTTLTRLSISNTTVWRTDLKGDISVNVDENGVFAISSGQRAE